MLYVHKNLYGNCLSHILETSFGFSDQQLTDTSNRIHNVETPNIIKQHLRRAD